MKINIDTGDLIKLSTDGKTFFWNPDAEESLKKLLEAQVSIENAIKTIKEELAKAGVKENPDFTGVRGSSVQASYAPHGMKYEIVDDKQVSFLLGAGVVSEKVSYSINSKAVDEFVARYGAVPNGMAEKKRKKSVTMKLV